MYYRYTSPYEYPSVRIMRSMNGPLKSLVLFVNSSFLVFLYKCSQCLAQICFSQIRGFDAFGLNRRHYFPVKSFPDLSLTLKSFKHKTSTYYNSDCDLSALIFPTTILSNIFVNKKVLITSYSFKFKIFHYECFPSENHFKPLFFKGGVTFSLYILM